MRQIILLTLTALLLQGRILATTYSLPTWEQLATTSEFIGLVECVTAGGIVARYQVIDSWKGAAVGTEMNISQHVDVYEPQFPISLVGERFLVFAEKTASYGIASFTQGGGVPLWWRKIPTDLRCFSLIPLKGPYARYYLSSYLGARTRQLDEFKAAVTDFLGCGKEEQELRLMLAAARKNLHLPNPTEPSDKGNEADIKLYDSLQSAKTVKELWKRIIEHASGLAVNAIPKTSKGYRANHHKFTLLSMLRDGGREQCQRLLEMADVSKLPWDKLDVGQTLSSIRRRLSPDVGQQSRLRDADANVQKTTTTDEIAKAETLILKPWDYETGAAFEMLCRHAPGSVVPYLLGWEPSKKGDDQFFGYLLGSAFGHLCAVDRTKHLKALASAKDVWIRVAAAVYLRFDDRTQGEDALRKMAMIEGDAGSWAALVLASRGDKAMMVRALEVMATPHEGSVQTGNRGNLQKRLRVLLSNAASTSGIPQPPASSKEDPEGIEQAAIQKQWHEAMLKWWNENQEKIVLADPWAKFLEEQKVD